MLSQISIIHYFHISNILSTTVQVAGQLPGRRSSRTMRYEFNYITQQSPIFMVVPEEA